MFSKILGVLFLILLGLFTLCSCQVASWADQEMEEEMMRREKDEEENL